MTGFYPSAVIFLILLILLLFLCWETVFLAFEYWSFMCRACSGKGTKDKLSEYWDLCSGLFWHFLLTIFSCQLLQGTHLLNEITYKVLIHLLLFSILVNLFLVPFFYYYYLLCILLSIFRSIFDSLKKIKWFRIKNYHHHVLINLSHEAFWFL